MDRVDMQKRALDAATFFLVLGLLLGILYCVIVPYGAGFDEERHLVRIYRMSWYLFLPNTPDLPVHKEIFDLSYQRRVTQSPAFDLFSSPTFTSHFSQLDADMRYGVRTNSIYSPVIFLPQSLIARLLWWKYDFPILPVIIVQKIAGLLLYIAGAYVAIRAVPYGKWIFAVLALSPAALYQASTLNADGFTNAVSFAFIGWVLAVYVNERSGIHPRSIWILSALAILLGLAKPGAIVLLPLLLILLWHPFPSKAWMWILGAGVVLSGAANIGWAMIATEGSSVFTGGATQSVSNQSSLILSDLGNFLNLLMQGIFASIPYEIRGWVAGYGYRAGSVPGPVFFFWALCLVAAFFCEPRREQISTRTRLFLIGLFFLCSTVIFSIAFAANYMTGGILALAKHGRYFIPFAPLFFWGCAGLFNVREKSQRPAQWIVVGSCLLAAGWFCFGIYTAYYTYCGYEAYMGATCSLPIYKNLEKGEASIAGLNSGERLNQTFINQCGALEAVSVYILSVPESADGSLRFSLLDGQGQTLASQDFLVRAIAADEYLNLPVQLPPGYHNKNFEIELEPINLPPLDKFRFDVIPEDIYPGQLSADGMSGSGDLLIHYTCTSP